MKLKRLPRFAVVIIQISSQRKSTKLERILVFGNTFLPSKVLIYLSHKKLLHEKKKSPPCFARMEQAHWCQGGSVVLPSPATYLLLNKAPTTNKANVPLQ